MGEKKNSEILALLCLWVKLRLNLKINTCVFYGNNFQLHFGVYSNFLSFLLIIYSPGRLKQKVKRGNAVDAEPVDFSKLLLRFLIFLFPTVRHLQLYFFPIAAELQVRYGKTICNFLENMENSGSTPDLVG